MKSKAPLLLMEQMVMLLVFALAAALCVQAFVRSDAASRQNAARDRAVVVCQNAAELIRHNGGNVEAALTQLHGEVYERDGVYHAYYDGDMNYIRSQPGCGMEAPETAYRLEVSPVDTGVDGLGRARVEVVPVEGNAVVFALDIAWQKGVGADG